MNKEQIIEEFETKFHRVGMDTNFGFGEDDGFKQLEDFILHAISTYEENLREKVAGMKHGAGHDERGCEHNATLNAVLALIK